MSDIGGAIYIPKVGKCANPGIKCELKIGLSDVAPNASEGKKLRMDIKLT